jgi:hypothetical protein
MTIFHSSNRPIFTSMLIVPKLLRVIIIIVIIIGKSALSEPQPSTVCHIRPVSTFLDFAKTIFYRARLSALRPTPNMEHQVSEFMSPSDRIAPLYGQEPGSFSSLSTNRRAKVEVL